MNPLQADETECCSYNKVSIAIGPPVNKENDKIMVNSLMNSAGKKIICGGTTAKIVAKLLNKPIKVLPDKNKTIPPKGEIDGIHLVFEGLITLSKTLEILEQNCFENLKTSLNPAQELAFELIGATHIEFYIGNKENQAYNNPDFPVQIGQKKILISKIIEKLKICGKKVEVHSY